MLSVSTAGNNRYLFHFSSLHSLTQWTAGIRLAMFEHASLQELYTGSLLAGKGKTLNNIRNIMERTRIVTEDWVRVRFGAGTPWRRCWCVITPPDEKEFLKRQKLAKKRSAYERSPPRPKGDVKFYDTKKTKKVQPVATISDAYAAYAIYPQSKPLIDQSTLIKVEGTVTIHSSPATTTEGFVFVMPEVRPAVAGFEIMLRWLFPAFDAFGLYGRPGKLIADTVDTHGLMFAMPKDRRYGYLEILDVAGLVHADGSQRWKEAEWRTQMKELTSKRMSALSAERPAGRSGSRRAARSSLQLPTRGNAIQLDDGSSSRSSPVRKSDVSMPERPANDLHFKSDPAASRLRHQRSVSEAQGLGPLQARSDHDTPPMPPTHGLDVRELSSGGRLAPMGVGGRRDSRDATQDRSSSETEGQAPLPHETPAQGLLPSNPPEPVASPPAFAHGPGAKPPSKPYHSPELRRANSRMSISTLSQMTSVNGGGGAAGAGTAASATASAAWRPTLARLGSAADTRENDPQALSLPPQQGNPPRQEEYAGVYAEAHPAERGAMMTKEDVRGAYTTVDARTGDADLGGDSHEEVMRSGFLPSPPPPQQLNHPLPPPPPSEAAPPPVWGRGPESPRQGLESSPVYTTPRMHEPVGPARSRSIEGDLPPLPPLPQSNGFVEGTRPSLAETSSSGYLRRSSALVAPEARRPLADGSAVERIAVAAARPNSRFSRDGAAPPNQDVAVRTSASIVRKPIPVRSWGSAEAGNRMSGASFAAASPHDGHTEQRAANREGPRDRQAPYEGQERHMQRRLSATSSNYDDAPSDVSTGEPAYNKYGVRTDPEFSSQQQLHPGAMGQADERMSPKRESPWVGSGPGSPSPPKTPGHASGSSKGWSGGDAGSQGRHGPGLHERSASSLNAGAVTPSGQAASGGQPRRSPGDRARPHSYFAPAVHYGQSDEGSRSPSGSAQKPLPTPDQGHVRSRSAESEYDGRRTVPWQPGQAAGAGALSGGLTPEQFVQQRAQQGRLTPVYAHAQRSSASSAMTPSGPVSPATSAVRPAHSRKPSGEPQQQPPHHSRKLSGEPQQQPMHSRKPSGESYQQPLHHSRKTSGEPFQQPPPQHRQPHQQHHRQHHQHQHQALPTPRGAMGGFGTNARPTSLIDYSSHLSGREQEHVSRATGGPMTNMAGPGRQPLQGGGLVGAIEAREREKKGIMEGVNNQMVQHAIMLRRQQGAQAQAQAQAQYFGQQPSPSGHFMPQHNRSQSQLSMPPNAAYPAMDQGRGGPRGTAGDPQASAAAAAAMGRRPVGGRSGTSGGMMSRGQLPQPAAQKQQQQQQQQQQRSQQPQQQQQQQKQPPTKPSLSQFFFRR